MVERVDACESEPGLACWTLPEDPGPTEGWVVLPDARDLVGTDTSPETWRGSVGIHGYAAQAEYRSYARSESQPGWIGLPLVTGPTAESPEGFVRSRFETEVDLGRGSYRIDFRLQRQGAWIELVGLSVRVPARGRDLNVAAHELVSALRYLDAPIPPVAEEVFDRYRRTGGLKIGLLAEAANTLEELGLEHAARGGFWRQLEKAAAIADLPEHRLRYRGHFKEAVARLKAK